MAGTLTTSAGTISVRSPNIHRCPSSFQSSSTVHVTNASLHNDTINKPNVRSMKTKNRSLYDVLNVNQNATPPQIKSAYRNLAKQYHPDTSKQNDDSEFIDICNAYATLFDPKSRALYDMKLTTAGIKPRSGGLYSDQNSYGFYAGRRWETDQCW